MSVTSRPAQDPPFVPIAYEYLAKKQEAHNLRRILEICPSDLMHTQHSDAMEDIAMGHMV